MNLANPEWKESLNISEDDFIEAFTETLTEEYTHMAIDDEITKVWLEYLEQNKGKMTPEEIAGYGHLMHEIGANAARGYSPLGTWLVIVGHANVPDDYRDWIVDNKLSNSIPEDLENNVLDTYTKLRYIYDSNEESKGAFLPLEVIIKGFKQLYGGGLRNVLV